MGPLVFVVFVVLVLQVALGCCGGEGGVCEGENWVATRARVGFARVGFARVGSGFIGVCCTCTTSSAGLLWG